MGRLLFEDYLYMSSEDVRDASLSVLRVIGRGLLNYVKYLVKFCLLLDKIFDYLDSDSKYA